MAGFTFVGRDAEVAAFRRLLERPQGEVLLVAGGEGTGKSHLLRRLRGDAERLDRHFVHFHSLGHLPDAASRLYAIIGAVAMAHLSGEPKPGEGSQPPRLVPDPREFFIRLMVEPHLPAPEKFLSLCGAAATHLPADSCFVLLLDLGRAEDDEAFPVEFLARRLPDRVKLVVATREVPAGLRELRGLDNASLIAELPPFTEPEVARILEFHHPRGTPVQALVGPTLAKFGGHPLLTDLSAKLVASVTNPAAMLADLPTAAQGLCRLLLARLTDEQRALAECVAHVASGLDTAALRTFLDISEADLRRLMLHDAVRNVVLTHRTVRGTEAFVFHEAFSDIAAKESSPETAGLHKRAAAHFLALALKDAYDIEALCAHSHHIRLSGDRLQFVQDFPKTLKVKQSLELLHLLAAEYRLLLMWCGKLGEDLINRPLAMASLGRVYEHLGQHDDALRFHRDALDVYEEQGNTAGKAGQLARIAAVQSDLGQMDEALKTLQQAAALNEASRSGVALAGNLASMGKIGERFEQFDEALRCYQGALDLHRALRDDAGAAAQLARIAAIHRRRGDLRAALAAFQESWRLSSRCQSIPAEIDGLCNLGPVFEELGDMEKAITCMQQALDLDHTLGDRKGEASHLRVLAGMQIKLGQADEAMASCEQAIAAAQAAGDRQGEAEGFLALAKAHAAADRLPEARAAIDEATAIAARLDDAETTAQAAALLATLEPTEPDAAPAHAPLATPPAEEEVDLEDSHAPAAPAGPAQATPELSSKDTEDALATLRRQLSEAQLRIVELEADVAKFRRLTDSLKTMLEQNKSL